MMKKIEKNTEQFCLKKRKKKGIGRIFVIDILFMD